MIENSSLPPGTIVFLTSENGKIKLHLHPSISPIDFLKLIAPIVEDFRIEAFKAAMAADRRVVVPEFVVDGSPNG